MSGGQVEGEEAEDSAGARLEPGPGPGPQPGPGPHRRMRTTALATTALRSPSEADSTDSPKLRRGETRGNLPRFRTKSSRTSVRPSVSGSAKQQCKPSDGESRTRSRRTLGNRLSQSTLQLKIKRSRIRPEKKVAPETLSKRMCTLSQHRNSDAQKQQGLPRPAPRPAMAQDSSIDDTRLHPMRRPREITDLTKALVATLSSSEPKRQRSPYIKDRSPRSSQNSPLSCSCPMNQQNLTIKKTAGKTDAGYRSNNPGKVIFPAQRPVRLNTRLLSTSKEPSLLTNPSINDERFFKPGVGSTKTSKIIRSSPIGRTSSPSSGYCVLPSKSIGQSYAFPFDSIPTDNISGPRKVNDFVGSSSTFSGSRDSRRSSLAKPVHAMASDPPQPIVIGRDIPAATSEGKITLSEISSFSTGKHGQPARVLGMTLGQTQALNQITGTAKKHTIESFIATHPIIHPAQNTIASSGRTIPQQTIRVRTKKRSDLSESKSDGRESATSKAWTGLNSGSQSRETSPDALRTVSLATLSKPTCILQASVRPTGEIVPPGPKQKFHDEWDSLEVWGVGRITWREHVIATTKAITQSQHPDFDARPGPRQIAEPSPPPRLKYVQHKTEAIPTTQGQTMRKETEIRPWTKIRPKSSNNVKPQPHISNAKHFSSLMSTKISRKTRPRTSRF